MTDLVLKVGGLYRGKRRRQMGTYNDDRVIVHISLFGEVQYDSYFVANGRHLPKTTKEKFLRWAKEEVVEKNV